MISIKILDTNKSKIEENSYKNIFIYCIGYVMIKKTNYAKINGVNPLCLINDKMNGYIEESNRNKYIGLFLTDESKNTPKTYEKLWSKIKDLGRSRTNYDDYDEKYFI